MENNKSIAECIFEEIKLEEDFYLLFTQNTTDETIAVKRNTGKKYLQFHFALKGDAELLFNGGHYIRNLHKEKSLVLYNPTDALPIYVWLAPNTLWVSLLICIEKLHLLFSKEAHFIAFLNEENRDKKYYREHNINPAMISVLNQILKGEPNAVVSQIYYKAKVLELLSLYFSGPRDIDLEQCPFLVDEKNVAKIRYAKEIIINRMAEPPTLQELADEILLPINSLKEGFKQVYGDTVFGFLLDYKMEKARQLLLDGSYNVNEVGLKLGYSAASHFIAAFKKKYGTTPKKYMMANARVSL